MNNKSITKLLETVAFSNGIYVLWNLYDGNIHISILRVFRFHQGMTFVCAVESKKQENCLESNCLIL